LEYPHTTATIRAASIEVEGQGHRLLKICGTKGTLQIQPIERFDGKPLQMRLSLLEAAGSYAAGTHMIDFGVQCDRYKEQLLELAKIINGEMKNPYTYKHDYLVQEVVLAASGYTKWKK